MKVKTNLFIILAILWANNSLFSQPSIGVQAGLIMPDNVFKSSGWYDGMEKIKDLNGFNIGLISDIKIGQKMSLQPAIVFSRYGFLQDDNGDDWIRMKEIFNFIQIPLFLNYKIEAGPINVFLNAGITPTLFIFGYDQEFYDINLNDAREKVSKGFDDVEGNPSVSLGIGTGVDYKSFTLGAKYNYDITGSIGEYSELKFNYFDITLSYFFFKLEK
jgi:hypothetical protein